MTGAGLKNPALHFNLGPAQAKRFSIANAADSARDLN
jgi:hypothetical protein